jgi:hypothetical protein
MIKQDQQGKAAHNDSNPHMTQQQEPTHEIMKFVKLKL